MYHHVNSDRCSNDLAIFEEHLKYIKNNFKTIFPGEEITSKSVCLTFDDAYADFYFLIFPLLKMTMKICFQCLRAPQAYHL